MLRLTSFYKVVLCSWVGEFLHSMHPILLMDSLFFLILCWWRSSENMTFCISQFYSLLFYVIWGIQSLLRGVGFTSNCKEFPVFVHYQDRGDRVNLTSKLKTDSNWKSLFSSFNIMSGYYYYFFFKFPP